MTLELLLSLPPPLPTPDDLPNDRLGPKLRRMAVQSTALPVALSATRQSTDASVNFYVTLRFRLSIADPSGPIFLQNPSLPYDIGNSV